MAMTVLKTREIDNSINLLIALGNGELPDMLKELKKANGEVADRLKVVQEKEKGVGGRETVLAALEAFHADESARIDTLQSDADNAASKATEGTSALRAARSTFESWSKAQRLAINEKQDILDAALAEIDRDKAAASVAKTEALDLKAQWEALKFKADEAFS